MNALEELVKPLAKTLELNTLPQHIHEVLGAYLLYEFIFRLVSPVVSSRLVSKYRTFDRRTRINWDIHFVSMIQCVIVSSLAVYAFLFDAAHVRTFNPLDFRNRLWAYSTLSGRVQAFAAGYFLWDTIACIVNIDSQGLIMVVHGIAALAITSIGFRPFANFYGINITLFEISTIFLNIHWFCDKLDLTGSTFQLINGIFFIVSFFLIRVLWGSFQAYSLYKDVHYSWEYFNPTTKVCRPFFDDTNPKAWIDTPWRCRVLPAWLGYTYIGVLGLFTVLNAYWLTQIISSVIRRFKPSKPKDEKKTQ